MKSCINGVNFIRLLLLFTELQKFKIQKRGQILCAHKPIFSCRVTIIVLHTCSITEYLFLNYRIEGTMIKEIYNRGIHILQGNTV